MRSSFAAFFAVALFILLTGGAAAEAPQPVGGADSAARAPDLSQTVPPHPLPPPSVTHHTVNLPSGPLRFKATAGAIRLSDAQSGAPLADVAYTAFEQDSAGAGQRPLTVVLNGGPGASSAWLDLGAVGPWRLPLLGSDISPSASAQVVDNVDTWLDFTDLLFIDPVGTGYSRTLGKGDNAEKQFYSVDGDISSLATVVRKWLVANNRLLSPKFILGESYGGFRAPKLARKLEGADSIGIDGIIMLSPVLDFDWFATEDNPAVYAAHLPSLVAAAKGLKGPNPREQLQTAEAYASGPYLVDLYRGRRDPAAMKRMSDMVANLTGLDPRFVQRLGGRVEASAMMRERTRDEGRIASSYDANVTGFDPHPFDATSHHEDPILDSLKVPFATAMADITAHRLDWPVQARYEILNMQVNNHWDWENGRRSARATEDLAQLLALDPRFRAIVMHGVTDQVTPYFTSKMLIDQLPQYGDPSRLRLVVYGGGHMPYIEGEPRAAMHEDARKLIVGEPPTALR